LTLPRLLDCSRAGNTNAGREWLRAVKALGGRARFHVGQLAKKLGIAPPSAWQDEVALERRRVEELDGVQILDYPQALHTAACRPGCFASHAMLLRAARSGLVEKVVRMAEALRDAFDRTKALFDALRGVNVENVKKVLKAAAERPLVGHEVALYTLARRYAWRASRVSMVLRN
jgi:hypothetical protein